MLLLQPWAPFHLCYMLLFTFVLWDYWKTFVYTIWYHTISSIHLICSFAFFFLIFFFSFSFWAFRKAKLSVPSMHWQAVMYVLCFRMRLLMEVPHLKYQLFHMPLEPILCHPLDPLKVGLKFPSGMHLVRWTVTSLWSLIEFLSVNLKIS